MTTLTTQDQLALDQAAELLDTAGMTSRHCAVTLHTVVALHLIAAARPLPPVTHRTAPADERAVLRDALQLLSHLSDEALRNEDLADALHNALLAYLAAR